jgi:hypothetical protein
MLSVLSAGHGGQIDLDDVGVIFSCTTQWSAVIVKVNGLCSSVRHVRLYNYTLRSFDEDHQKKFHSWCLTGTCIIVSYHVYLSATNRVQFKFWSPQRGYCLICHHAALVWPGGLCKTRLVA